MWRWASLVLLLLLAPLAQAAPLGLGRAPTAAELEAWDIDVRPDGTGLPKGRGTAREGEALYQERCASCHGEFGEGVNRWPELAGGEGSLNGDRPLRTIGSYWPYVTTVFDFLRHAMPFGNAQSLVPDEIYAVTAYLLGLNDVVKDEDFELNERTLPSIRLPNEAGFFDDDREVAEAAFWNRPVCMAACTAEVRITGRAAVLDVTPDTKSAPRIE